MTPVWTATTVYHDFYDSNRFPTKDLADHLVRTRLENGTNKKQQEKQGRHGGICRIHMKSYEARSWHGSQKLPVLKAQQFDFNYFINYSWLININLWIKFQSKKLSCGRRGASKAWCGLYRASHWGPKSLNMCESNRLNRWELDWFWSCWHTHCTAGGEQKQTWSCSSNCLPWLIKIIQSY